MPTDTQVNDLKINVLTEAQYEQMRRPSSTELYLVPETVDTVPTQNSTNTITSGAVYSALQNIPAQEQSDWRETDTADPAFIKNKPQNIVTDSSYVHTDNNYTTTEKNKLAGIENGAEVNVQSDWNQSDSTADDYIKHKPSVAQPMYATFSVNNNVVTCDKTVHEMAEWLSNGNIVIATLSLYAGFRLETVSYAYEENQSAMLYFSSVFITDNGVSFIIYGESTYSNNAWLADTWTVVEQKLDYSNLTNTPTIDTTLSETSTNAVQNKAINVLTRKLWDNVDVQPRLDVEYMSYENYIATPTETGAGTWRTNSTYRHWAIPIDGMRLVEITANNDYNAWYTFLKSHNSYTGGTTPDYATGYDELKKVDKETSMKIPVPFDAKYIYINTGNTSSSIGTSTPSHIYMTGIGITAYNGNGSGFVKDNGLLDLEEYQPALPSYLNNSGKVLAINSNATGLEWVMPVKIYSGTSAPSSSTGSDGDIYIQTTA